MKGGRPLAASEIEAAAELLDRGARWSGCTMLKPRWPEPTNPVSEVPGTVHESDT